MGKSGKNDENIPWSAKWGGTGRIDDRFISFHQLFCDTKVSSLLFRPVLPLSGTNADYKDIENSG